MQKHALMELEQETRKLKLLYVEDNAEARIATLMVLNEFFSDITTAVDGKQGLDAAQKQAFDLILTDINMPEMNGLEMLRALRDAGNETPAIILSAYNEQNYFTESIKIGVEGYLLKPVEIEQFLDIMNKVTQKMKMMRENVAYKEQLEEMVASQTKEIRAKANRIYQQSIIDSLTGLYNATMLNQLLEKSNYNYVMILDIANFGIINKQYGKRFGNAIIKEAARVLQRQMKENMRLFKIESDRFAIAIKGVEAAEVEMLARQIIAFFDATNLEVQGSEININFSIGAVEVAKEDDAMLQAEFAISWSKHVGRRSYYLYERDGESMQREQETIRWLNRTKELIMQEKIEPYFQPIKNLKTGKIERYEVLARGIDEDEIIAPINFLGAAERLGLITAITRMIVKKSFAYFSENAFEYDFSINISDRDLSEGGFVEFMVEKARHYNIEPSRVTCEILEGITMLEHSHQMIEELKRLRRAGFKLAVDDFGVENSNFSRLLDIDLDFIKIDGIFIRNILKRPKDQMIVTAIVNLARTMHIATIAEFVEDAAIYEALLESGVDYVQGYYIGKPSSLLLEG